ncbi:unnamed protein product [Trifolium pratense]|uniref:Uncharacterized protein n=1 Tax=Trifolium pratense TaxID=57577 RepID=A0ACB0JLI7_TRIPR|nr:unnamed protein product [Trifolium pratense]
MSILKNHYLAQDGTKSWLYVYDYDDALLINLSFIHSDLAGVRTSNERKENSAGRNSMTTNTQKALQDQ